MNMGWKQGFYTVVDEFWLGHTPYDNITDTFELLVDQKDTYSYPVEGWIWANSELEARKILKCYGPKPYESWIVNEETCEWQAPINYPSDKKVYMWSEDDLNWQEFISN
jgi:hypothetical protein